MKKLIFPLILLMATPVLAAKIKDATCFDVERVTDDITPAYLAVADGYDKAGKKVEQTVDAGEIVSLSKKINRECMKDNDLKVTDLRKAFDEKASTKTTETLNPLKATCKDFIALGDDVQPVAVFWVAGHDRAGVIKKGEFDQKFLSQPVVAVINDCRANPTASFYDRAKIWISQNI